MIKDERQNNRKKKEHTWLSIHRRPKSFGLARCRFNDVRALCDIYQISVDTLMKIYSYTIVLVLLIFESIKSIKSKYFNEAENFTGHEGSNDR